MAGSANGDPKTVRILGVEVELPAETAALAAKREQWVDFMVRQRYTPRPKRPKPGLCENFDLVAAYVEWDQGALTPKPQPKPRYLRKSHR